MLILPQEEIWTQQPQVVTGIDWSNPLTRGLTLLIQQHPSYGGRVAMELVRGLIPVAGAGVGAVTLTQSGVGVNYPNGVSNCATSYALNAATQRPTADFTVMVIGQFPTGSTAIAVANSYHGASGQIRLQPNYTGSVLQANAFAFLTYRTNFTNAGATAVLTGRPQTFIGRRRLTEHTLWVDGRLCASVTGTVRDVSDVPSLHVGNLDAGDIYGAGGPIMLSAQWNRALTDSECAILSATASSPYQIFAP